MATTTVTGSDGVVPITQPNARWTQYALSDVFMGAGTVGTNKYVPNVNDYVIDLTTRDTYYVSAVDQTTLVPTLVVLPAEVPESTISDEDLLIGVGPGTTSETYRVYFDTSVTPNKLSVDNRLRVFSSEAETCQVFRGSTLDGTGVVISAVLDSSGTLLTQAIPLTLALVPAGDTNYTIKSVPQAYSTVPVNDGELLTAVIYSGTGAVVSKNQLVAENTAYISTTDASVKYITSIALSSPFMSESDPTLIQYPLNVPVSGLNLLGIVNYSDGTSLTLPIDGSKFSISGLTSFIATVVSQQQPLVLQYTLSSGEVALAKTNGLINFLTASYTAITIAKDGNYTVKLYCYPVWVSATAGYTLEWFLYNLDRNIYYRVTSLVSLSTNSAAFNPTLYGTNQQLTVQINLNAVNGSYNSLIQVQVVNIVLLRAGTNKGSNNWTVGFTASQSPQYGTGNYATTVYTSENYSTINVASGYTTQAAWLNALYYAIDPLYDASTETGPLVPTHYSLYYGDSLLSKQTISAWNTTIVLSSVLTDLANVDIHWTYETSTSVLELGISALQIQQEVSSS